MPIAPHRLAGQFGFCSEPCCISLQAKKMEKCPNKAMTGGGFPLLTVFNETEKRDAERVASRTRSQAAGAGRKRRRSQRQAQPPPAERPFSINPFISPHKAGKPSPKRDRRYRAEEKAWKDTDSLVARLENYRRPRGDSQFLSPKRKRPRRVEPAAPEHKQQTPEPESPLDVDPLPDTEPVLIPVEPSASAKPPPTTLKKSKRGRQNGVVKKKSKRGGKRAGTGRPKINAPKQPKLKKSKRLHMKAAKEKQKAARKAAREAG